MDHSLAGLYVPLITPLRSSGELAVDALEALAHSVIDAGAAGLVALGTTAEATTLSAGERRAILDTCARVCRERSATLVAGAGSNDTHASAQALRDLAAWPEVSAALTVVPYFTRPSEDGVIAHFTRLAAESPLPLIVYNVPGRTGQVVGWRALRKLAGLAGIIGVKHAVGGIDEDTVRLMADLPDGFAVLGGDDVFASPILALGAAPDRAETYVAGDAYYAPPGHLPLVTAGTAVVEFSPTADLEATMAVVQKNLSESG